MKINKMKKYIILAATALSFAACNNDNEPATSADGTVALEVNAAISGTQTRASGEKWATGDRIGISTLAGTGTNYSNVPYRYNGAKFEPNAAPIYFQTGEEVTFYAYYPYREDATYNSVSTGADMQTAEKQPTIDFLFASGATASKNSPTVSFTGDYAFTHRMSQIAIEFAEGKGMDLDGNLTDYTLSGLTLSGRFDTSTGVAALADEAEATNLTLALSGVATTDGKYTTAPVIVFPQEVTSMELAVTVDGQTYRATLTVPSVTVGGEAKSGLQAGHSYLFPVTVNKTELEVGTATIKNWETVTADGANATM